MPMSVGQTIRLIFLGACAVCVVARAVVRDDQSPTTVSSPNHRVQITLPKGWKTAVLPGASEEFLQAKCPAKNACVMVIGEAKQDFKHQSLLQYARSILAQQKAKSKLIDRTYLEPKELKISGANAIQVQVRGSLKNVNLVYLDTFIETATGWNQVLCWTLPSCWDECQDDFRAILESLTELPNAP
jgi:hypothetical protein